MCDEETEVETPVRPRGVWERLALIGLPRLAVGVVLLAAIIDLSFDYFTDVTRAVKPSVVAVVCFDKSGKRLAEGSGFFVDQRHVVTNRHLILGAQRAEISIGRSRRGPGGRLGQPDGTSRRTPTRCPTLPPAEERAGDRGREIAGARDTCRPREDIPCPENSRVGDGRPDYGQRAPRLHRQPCGEREWRVYRGGCGASGRWAQGEVRRLR